MVIFHSFLYVYQRVTNITSLGFHSSTSFNQRFLWNTTPLRDVRRGVRAPGRDWIVDQIKLTCDFRQLGFSEDVEQKTQREPKTMGFNGGFMVFYGGLMGFNGIYPAW